MHKSLVLVALTALLLGSPASAQEASHFGKRGTFSLGVERLFGVVYTTDIDVTAIELGVAVGPVPYSVPRLALDYFVTDQLSFGLGAGLGVATDGGTATAFSFNPRVGYAIVISPHVSFWPRAGFSYLHLSDGTSQYFLAFTLEGQFVFTPVRHLGLLLGPTLDIGLAASFAAKPTQIGLQTGIVGWF